MPLHEWTLAAAAAVVLLLAGLLSVPIVFAERVAPNTWIGNMNVTGVSQQDLPGVLRMYQQSLENQEVGLHLRGKQTVHPLRELGMSVDIPGTAALLTGSSSQPHLPINTRIQPVLHVDNERLGETVKADFIEVIDPAQSASLSLTPAGGFTLVKSASGEDIDYLTLEQDIRARVASSNINPVELTVISVAVNVQDNETNYARDFATRLLREGITLTFENEEFIIQPFTIRRLLQFVEQVDPHNAGNHILGVGLDPEGFREYLVNTIVPVIDQPAQNARFELAENRVEQFALPQPGRQLNIDATVQNVAAILARANNAVPLTVAVTEPEIASVDNIQTFGITSLLATGQSDFAGSPRNRIHNIEVGASRYHGLLIPSGQEFSFNTYLGPVDGVHGFKPELVIKANVTTPEFGGGLCQVSTTAFRAAIQAGLQITQRRNHSYAVSYYGTPGFDATIYPPYTDLRFLNNTPSYILIQTKIEGTTLVFEFWGTNDGREVAVDGPNPYSRQSNGAVKATLAQKVVREGDIIVEDTFYSNYKSPKLFPKVLAANNEKLPDEPAPTPAPQPLTSSQNDHTTKPAKPTKSAAPSPTPAPTSPPESEV